MQPPNFPGLPVKYPGFFGSVADLHRLLRGAAADYEYMGSKRGSDVKPKFDAKAASLRAIADRVKNAESVEEVRAILTEKNMQFKGGELINDNVSKLGGKSRKGKSKKGKSKKGKSKKNKTRRR